MNIVEALKLEEAKLQRQLAKIRNAIIAMNGSKETTFGGWAGSGKTANGKRTMSAAARAKISRAAKARWAKIRADKAKKGK
jgi:hypothetical protein